MTIEIYFFGKSLKSNFWVFVETIETSLNSSKVKLKTCENLALSIWKITGNSSFFQNNWITFWSYCLIGNVSLFLIFGSIFILFSILKSFEMRSQMKIFYEKNIRFNTLLSHNRIPIVWMCKCVRLFYKKFLKLIKNVIKTSKLLSSNYSEQIYKTSINKNKHVDN